MGYLTGLDQEGPHRRTGFRLAAPQLLSWGGGAGPQAKEQVSTPPSLPRCPVSLPWVEGRRCYRCCWERLAALLGVLGGETPQTFQKARLAELTPRLRHPRQGAG